jgi:hypothetical protein
MGKVNFSAVSFSSSVRFFRKNKEKKKKSVDFLSCDFLPNLWSADNGNIHTYNNIHYQGYVWSIMIPTNPANTARRPHCLAALRAASPPPVQPTCAHAARPRRMPGTPAHASCAPPAGAKDELQRLIGSDDCDVRLENGTDSLPPPRFHCGCDPFTPEVCATDELCTSDLCATPGHRAPHRRRAPYVLCVLDVCSICFSWTLHVFHLDIIKVNMMFHMLQWLEMYVSNVCFKWFSYFRHILQVFYLDIAYVAVAIHICCKRMF